MTRLEELRLEMKKYDKYRPYFYGFYSLTQDERERVRSKHPEFNAFLTLQDEEMRILQAQLMKALEVGSSQGSALQIEPLDISKLEWKVFSLKDLKLWKDLKK